MILMLAAALMTTTAGLPNLPKAPTAAVTLPHWDRLPTGAEVYALYPPAAVSAHVEGAALVNCRATTDGAIANCAIISETPAGYGFGAATIKAAHLFHLTPVIKDGKPTEAYVHIPIRWRLTK
ncbi:MAG: energy transducer TonB [Caulobacteraceae bacterium]